MVYAVKLGTHAVNIVAGVEPTAHCGGTVRWLRHKALHTSDADNQRLGKDCIVKGSSLYGRYANGLDRVQHIQQSIA